MFFIQVSNIKVKKNLEHPYIGTVRKLWVEKIAFRIGFNLFARWLLIAPGAFLFVGG